MKRWFFALAIGLFLTPALMYSAARVLPPCGLALAREVGDCWKVKEQFAQESAKPQILIVAGSNALYGFSSLYALTHEKIRSVNLGLHAGLGLSYMLESAMGLARAGDMIVLPLEYALYGPEKYDNALRLQALVNDTSYFDRLPWREKAVLVANITFPEWLLFARERLKPNGAVGGGCRPENLSRLGDIITNPAGKEPAGVRERLAHFQPKAFSLADETKKRLRLFSEAAREKGVRVALTYPNLLTTAFDEEKNAAFFRDLRTLAAAIDVPLVGEPAERVFSLQDCFDTEYHVNDRRQIENTRILLRQLTPLGLDAYREKKER